jgi:tetratricopeptide (TPR) repeat protein
MKEKIMNHLRISLTGLMSALIIISTGQSIAQQNLPFIRVSPQAKVVQHISFAEIEIDYSRPGVKGREIYGKLVPFGLSANPFGNGKPMPWRAGADENTTIRLSHDAKINGEDLPAGIYGVHMLVHEDEWSIIFSKDYRSWGSFFYEESRDALRIKVKPQSTDFVEWLVYGFENIADNACDAFMAWGDKKVSFSIAFDLHPLVLATYRESLKGLAGFNQAAWGAAARYCMQNKFNLEEAMTWIDKALAMNGGDNFNNKIVKAGLLSQTGKAKESEDLLNTSLSDATEIELNIYGYQLMGQNKLDEAIRIFKINIKRHPDSWNVYDSLGEALNNKGDKQGAKENYEKAYKMAPADQKPRIEGILKNL